MRGAGPSLPCGVAPRPGQTAFPLGKNLATTGAVGVSDLFWIFFMFSALQPMLRQRLLNAARQRQIAKIERVRVSRVILVVHRQETMSFLGFPVLRYIDINDSEEILRAIHMTDPRVAVDLVLHTPGGLVLAALQIARAIHKRPGKVTVFVPHYAMSGGTLIALAADEIVMSEHAMLGPVDPQLGQYPAASILQAVARKPIQDVDDATLILADQAEKATAQLRAAVREFLADDLAPDKSEELAGLLTGGTWTHDYGITFEAAKAFGLNVRNDIPADVLQLMSLFPQPKRQGVEYLPVPYRYKEPTAPGGRS
jgi:ClpP class serine protease